MKNAKKLILVLAVAAFVFACVACGKDGGDTKTTPTPTTAAPTSATTDVVTPTEAPRDLKGLEVSIIDWWSDENWNAANNNYQIAYFDMLNDAMEKYNFKFTRKNCGVDWGQVAEQCMLSITDGNPWGSIITLDNTWVAGLLNTGAFTDVAKVSTINWSDEKFNQSAIKAMTAGDAIYGFAAGFEPRTGVFLNGKLFKQAGLDVSAIYDLQAQGKWTWDELYKFAKQLTRDTNNDGQTDIWGITGQNTVFFNALMYTNGTDMITGSADGKLNMNSGDAKITEALTWGRKFYDDGYFRNSTEEEDAAGQWDFFKTAFGKQEVAMYVEEEYAINDIHTRGLTEEIGFVVFPYGPSAGKQIVICRENILFVPSCESTKKDVEDILFAYNIYTDVPEDYKNDEERFLAQYENLFPDDERAVKETILGILTNKWDSYMTVTTMIPNFAPDYLYALGGRTAVVSEILEENIPKWTEQVNEFNAKYNQ